MKRMILRVEQQKDGLKVKMMIEVLTLTKTCRIKITWRKMRQRDLRKSNIRQGLAFKLKKKGLRSKSQTQIYKQLRDK